MRRWLCGVVVLGLALPVHAGGRLRGEAREAAVARIDVLLGETRIAYDAADYAGCGRASQEALELARRALDKDAPRLATAVNNLGNCLEATGAYADAEVLFQEALDIRVASDRVGIVPVIYSCNDMGSVREHQGDVQDAREWYQTAWGFLIEHQIADPVAYVVANNLASASTTLGDHETAETLYVWVLQSYEILHGPDHLLTAMAVNNLAFLYGEQGRTADAKTLWLRALAIYETLAPEHPDVASVHGNLAFALQGEGDLVGAQTHLERALAVRVAALGPAHPDVAVDRMNLAALLSSAGDLDGTAREYQAAVESLEASVGTQHPLVAVALSGVGAVALEAGHHAAARPPLERAVQILTDAYGLEHDELAYPLYSLAQLDHDLGHYEAARVQVDRAVALFQAAHGPDHPELGAMLTLQGAIRAALGDHVGAREATARAIDVAQAAWGEGSPAVGHAWNAYGALLLSEGDTAGALVALERARQILEQALGAGHAETSAVLNNLAYGNAEQGHYVEARALYEQALAIEERVYGPQHPQPATIRHNMGILMHEQGDAVAARRYYERALADKEAALGPMHPSVATTLDKLADLDGWQGALGPARRRAERSLAIREQALGAEHPDTGHSHVQLAMLSHRAGDLDAAVAGYAAAQAVWSAAGLDATDMATRVRVLQGGVLFEQGDVDGAVALLEQALEETAGRTAPGEPGRAWIERRLAVVLAAKGDTERARDLVARSLAANEITLGPVLARAGERSRLAMVRSHRESLDVVLSLFDQPGDAAQAYRGVLRWKGVATRSLARQQAQVRGQDDPELRAWLAELAQVRAELARRTWSGQTDGLEDLTLRKEALQQDLAGRSADLAEDLAVIEASARALCEALPTGGALVDLLRYERTQAGQGKVHTETHYAAFVLRQGACDGVSRVPLGPAAPLEAAVARHRALLASGAVTARSDKAGEALRALAWDPLLAALGDADPVLIVPDGALATVAYAALPRDGVYLLEQRAVGYLESAQDLLRGASDRRPGQGALVVGGVQYDHDGPALASLDPAGTRAAGCLSELVPLPATLTEAQAVRAALGPGTQLLSGVQASESQVAHAAAGKRVVHLATHGFFATDACRSALVGGGGDDAVLGMNPMVLSGLALAGANDGGVGPGDGVWTAEEIAALSLEGTDLVVLSACDTALGTIHAGEGVLGLRRAFTLSGAGTTVMSLWPVDDVATAWLMAELYAGLDQTAPPAALRRAQLALLAHNRTGQGEARPETWAAFIASGGRW